METVPHRLFEAIREEPVAGWWAGRIRLHSEPEGESERLTEVGHFLVDAHPAEGSDPEIECFIGAQYRSSRGAIEQAIRDNLAARPSAGAITAEVRLRFYWTTPEPERERVARPAAAPAGSQGVSYIPDTDERVVEPRTSFWQSRGPTLLASAVAALAFIAGVALIAGAIPHFVSDTGEERPAGALPDLVVGLTLLVLPLYYLISERGWVLLVIGLVLWILAGGHLVLAGHVGAGEIGAALLGVVAAGCATLVGRKPQAPEVG